jgi:flagellar basal body-associated protein FliL
MSDEAAAEGTENPEEGEKPAKKKGGGGAMVPMLLGVLNLGVSGFLLFKTLTHKPPEPPPPPPGEALLETAGPVAEMEPFILNLTDEGPQSRYLKAKFEIELANDKAMKDFEKAKRAVRDEVLRYLSGLSVAQTLGAENKEKIQGEILARVEKQLGRDRARRVFIQDFVVQ